MQEILIVTKTIASPSDQVWAAISSIGGLNRWFPIISNLSKESAPSEC